MTIFDHAVINGELMPLEQAQISFFNKAFFFSFGVYESVQIDRGRPFYLEEHLRRLRNSADLLNIDLGVTIPTMSAWFEQLRRVESQATWSLRITATGPVEPSERPVIGFQADPLPTYPAEFYRDGATAVLFEGQRFMPACKSLNTLVNYLARRAAAQAKAVEGLLHHQGCLTEGSRSNLFAVRQGQLISPPRAEILSGITREVITQVMADTPYPVVEEPIAIDLSLYEELFITSTSMHVMPITRVEGQTIGKGQVGPVTRLAMERFEQHYAEVIGG